MLPFILCAYAFGLVAWDIWDFEAFSPFSAFAREGWALRIGSSHPILLASPFFAFLAWLVGKIGGGRKFTWIGFGLLLLVSVACAIYPAYATASGASERVSLGWGAFLYLIGLAGLASNFLADRFFFSSDRFLASAVLLSFFFLGLFILLPITTILITAFLGPDGFSLLHLWNRLKDYGILATTFANTLWLALIVSTASTAVGVCLALVIVRSRFKRFKVLWKVFSILPLITPPFVVGLSLIFLFGRAGFITNALFGLEKNFIIGLPGIALTQIFSFTPISFLVISGLLQGIDPTLEEASFVLHGSQATTFRRITWKLLRPALANSFLLTMIESFADFANPIIIGGDYHVLSTEIYFAVIGKFDPPLAASLSLVLLLSTLIFFVGQRAWLGKRSYVTITGKPQARTPSSLPRGLDSFLFGFAFFWSAATFLLYLFFFIGAFVKIWGIDYHFTLDHFRKFRIDGLSSFLTSFTLSLLAAPVTAVAGLLLAYLTARRRFLGRGFLEFVSLINFAIPGTVVGLGFLLAFNDHPIPMTGTASILIFCFVFRNMAVGMRAGVASLSQIDRNLEEASLTLRAGLATTLRRILFPLLKDAVLSATAYSFVRAITAISAIIFLVSAEWNLATKLILDRIEYGRLGVATAYCTILVFLMGLTLLFTHWMVKRLAGKRSDLTEIANA